MSTKSFLQFSFVPIFAVGSLDLLIFLLPAEAGRPSGHFRVVLFVDFVELRLGVGDIEVFFEGQSHVF